MRASLRTLLASTPLLALACAGNDGGRGDGGASASSSASITATSATSASSSSSSSSSSGTTHDTSSAGESATSSTATSAPATMGDVKFDLGDDTTTAATTGDATGCKKVDFLFVIDNSASMEDNQAALIASFPGFIDAIKGALEDADDYHVMVVDTDDDGRCKQPCDYNTSDVMKFCSPELFHACKTQLSACDTTIGAGTLHPVGLYATNAACTISGGNRYMLANEPDLLGAFACVAKVGTAGNPAERPMDAIVAAVAPGINAPGGCNAGFLRDDAILVITFISDDPNYEDAGNAAFWRQAVLDAKGGNADAIVVAGLIPLPDQGCGGQGKTNGTHWKEFIDSFGDHGIAGAVCAADYSPFFAQAVGLIADACDGFIPG